MSTQTFEALGFDPAPGMPPSVEKVVTSLSRSSKQLHDAHSVLSKLGQKDAAWAGEAAEAFSKKLDSLPKYLNDGHHSLSDAAQAMRTWQSRLTDFQSLAKRYESEAEAARTKLDSAKNNPDLQLANKTFDTDAALQSAQRRLDGATSLLNGAQGELNAIIRKAEELLEEHARTAREAARKLREAAEVAPDQSFWDKFKDLLSSIGDGLAKLAGDIWDWCKKNADLLYKIGDWLGYASAACDVLAVLTSETIIGAVVFEAIGMTLNAGALAFHAVGWAAGAKKGSWVDIGLDIAGFVPFGDFLRLAKVGKGAFTGVKIPMNVLDFGGKAADAWKRADDIIDHVGRSAKYGDDVEKWFKRTPLGSKAHAIHVTADNLGDRLKVAVAKEFGDANLYGAAKGLLGGKMDVVPDIIEKTPLRHIPALADSVKPIIDSSGEKVGRYIDPRSWTARGVEAVTGAHNLQKEAVRLVTDPVEYGSEKVHQGIDSAKDTFNDGVSKLKDLNPF